MRAEATASGDLDTEAALRTALRVGAARRDAYRETKRILTARRASLREHSVKNDTYWATEMLACVYSADNIVDRDEALFFDEDNTVEIAAARQHIIDLDTAAEKVSGTFKNRHQDIPWKNLARTRDRFAHDYLDINRNIVWNVLTVEFPRIRTILRNTLGT